MIHGLGPRVLPNSFHLILLFYNNIIIITNLTMSQAIRQPCYIHNNINNKGIVGIYGFGEMNCTLGFMSCQIVDDDFLW